VPLWFALAALTWRGVVASRALSPVGEIDTPTGAVPSIVSEPNEGPYHPENPFRKS